MTSYLSRVRSSRAAAGLFLLIAFASLVASGCGSNEQPQAPSASQSGERRYKLKGTIVSIDRPQKHLVVNHEEIPDFMAAMTMPYPVVDEETLDRVNPGDEITGDVVVTESNMMRLENVVVVKKAEGAPAPSGGQLQQNGDRVPDFAMVNQDGRRIALKDYKGKAVLVTFIYTRCPLLDYCPLMTHNFATIEKTLAAQPAVYDKTHLLCISFDPKVDTPEVLKSYGESYAPDKGKKTFSHWEFATVAEKDKKELLSFFNIFYSEEGSVINHSMRTAIISADGTLYRWYNDGTWKPADLVADLNKLLASQSS